MRSFYYYYYIIPYHHNDSMELKFHRSVTLSAKSIEFIDGLDGKSFSADLDKVIDTFKLSRPDFQRAEALEQLRSSIAILKTCAPNDAIRAWAREALRGEK